MLPVIVLANSSLTDGLTKVKTELVSRAAEVGNATTATCFEIAWQEWFHGGTVVSAMAVLVKQSDAELVTKTFLELPVDMSRSIDHPTTYDYKVMLVSDQEDVESSRRQAVKMQRDFLQARRYLQLDGLSLHCMQHQVPTVTGLASSKDCNAWTVQQLLMSSSDLLELGGIFISSPFSKLQMTLEGVYYLQYDEKDSAIVEWNKPRIWSLLKH